MQSEQPSLQKIVSLEAARGLAAIITVLHHCAQAFLPELKSNFPEGLARTPIYFLVNGEAAVFFFFGLSGFVLTMSAIRKNTVPSFTVMVVKRLPRLWLPVAISVFAGCLILFFSLDRAPAAAAEITGSSWLLTFAAAGFPPNFEPGLSDAFAQSFAVFLGGPTYYNTNLWTMPGEFFGSLVVFALVLLSLIAPGAVVNAVCLIGAAILCHLYAPILLPFIFGAAVAYLHPLLMKLPPANTVVATLGIAGCLLAFSTRSPFVFSLASAALIALLLKSPALAKPLSGWIGRQLGRLSFALYLVHTLVILSLGSAVYVGVDTNWGQWPAVTIACAASIVASVAIAIPLMWVDEWWVKIVNAVESLSRRHVVRVHPIAQPRNIHGGGEHG